jgi:hypothetical protein
MLDFKRCLEKAEIDSQNNLFSRSKRVVLKGKKACFQKPLKTISFHIVFNAL